MLGVTELNLGAASSVVLIHGAFTNSTSWKESAVYFDRYHILIPDLPSHGRSRKDHPTFSTIDAADLIADVVRHKGKNGGKARIVGHSLGSHVAVHIISRHPDIVDEAAVLLGYNIWSEVNTGLFAGLGWLGARVGDLLPASKEAQERNKDEDGVSHPPQSWVFWKSIAGIICTEAWPEPWPARTLIIAAGNKGGAPVTDRPESARRLRDIAIKSNPESKAYWNSSLVHDWPREKPELLAQTLLAWFHLQPLPEGFVKLS